MHIRNNTRIIIEYTETLALTNGFMVVQCGEITTHHPFRLVCTAQGNDLIQLGTSTDIFDVVSIIIVAVATIPQ